MEKRNIVEQGRTPDFDKQADLDEVERGVVDQFRVTAVPADRGATVTEITDRKP